LFGQPTAVLLLVIVGMVLAGVAAFLSTKFLLKYFEKGNLYPFAIYCWVGGLIALIVFIAVLHAKS
jgi:undecaprenyl-diphosphatase